MKRSYFPIFLLLMTLLGVGAFSSANRDGVEELMWVEDFSNNKLNNDVWSKVVGDGCPNLCGWGNNELQYYTDKSRNVRLENNQLVIEAHRENSNGKAYTSGKVVTKNKADWKHGRIEIRAKLPSGRGAWTAFWMLPTVKNRKWPDDGEIDIMEHVGFNEEMIYGAIHTKKYNGMYGNHKVDSIAIMDSDEEFHTYSLEWKPESIKWLVDDAVYFSLDKDDEDNDGWPFNENAHHLIINLAVGGNWGGRMGIDDSIWPQKVIVDYVKYYKINSW